MDTPTKINIINISNKDNKLKFCEAKILKCIKTYNKN